MFLWWLLSLFYNQAQIEELIKDHQKQVNDMESKQKQLKEHITDLESRENTYKKQLEKLEDQVKSQQKEQQDMKSQHDQDLRDLRSLQVIYLCIFLISYYSHTFLLKIYKNWKYEIMFKNLLG